MLQEDSLRTGDLCPHCQSGRVFVRRSSRRGVVQVRYYECRGCAQRTRANVDARTVATRRRSQRRSQSAVSNPANAPAAGDDSPADANNTAAAIDRIEPIP